MTKTDRLIGIASGALIVGVAATVLALIGLARVADMTTRLDSAEASLSHLQCERDHARHPNTISCLGGEKN